MRDPATSPMGRLEAFDVGPRKLTIQTEFFVRPSWRFETKIYLAGELKKIYTEELREDQEAELQGLLNAFHQARMDELMTSLKNRKG